MATVDIILFVVLEFAVLFGVIVFLLNRERKRLQAQLQALQSGTETPETFESIASGYLPYLEKQILESRAQLESVNNEPEADTASAEALNYRLSLLEAEKKVTERSNDYPENRWQHVTELFSPPEALEPEPVEISPEAQPEDDDSLRKAQARIRSLETFRDKFFAMKAQLQALREARDKLLAQLEALLPEAEQSEEFKALLETLNAKHNRLQDEMAQLQSQSEEMAKPILEGATPGQSESPGDVAELSEQLDKQKQKMAELHQVIEDLQVEAEKSEALQAELDQFNLATRDMNMCIQVLEEENEFLQAQIKSLLELDAEQTVYDTAKPEHQEQLDAMQAQVDEKDQQIKSLEEKYAAMEKEYLTLYEEANS